MHHLDIDWLELARRAAIWRSLTLETRRTLLGYGPGEPVPVERLGADRNRLVAEQFVAQASTGRAGFHVSHRAHARALRAMQRHDLLADPSQVALARYLQDQYTAAERHQLAGRGTGYWTDSAYLLARRASSAAWVGPALDAADMRASPRRDAGLLVRAVLAAGGSVLVEELPQLLESSVPCARLSAAVLDALGQAWLFATMRADDLLPTLALWPPAAARLRRGPAPAPQPHLPALEAGLPFLMDDAAAAVIAASAEPLRLRGNDHTLFARAAQRVHAALAPLPKLLHSVANWTAEVRTAQALSFLHALRYVRVAGREGRDLRLQVTPSGRDWLAQPAAERLKRLIACVRPTQGEAGVRAGARGSTVVMEEGQELWDDLELDAEDVVFNSADSAVTELTTPRQRLPLLSREIHPPKLRNRLESAAVAAYADGADAFVSLDAFAAYHAEQRNPLLAESDRTRGYIGGIVPADLTEEEREELWAHMLVAVLLNRLLPLGGASIGHLEGIGPGFRISGAGRYLLGLTDRFDATQVPGLAAPQSAAARIVVQPNFDVVFLAPAPAAEAEIGRFAERAGSGVGTLFRVTRDAVYAAAGAGLNAEAALEALRRHSSQPLPQNVAREVAGWFAACRRARAGTAYLVRFPDEDSATRALAAAGRDVRRIAPTILEVIDPKQRAAVARKLRKQGIFVEEPAEGRKGRS